MQLVEETAQKKQKVPSKPRMCWNAKTGKWSKQVTKFFNQEIAKYCGGFEVDQHNMILVEDLDTLLSAKLVEFLKTLTIADLFNVINAQWGLAAKGHIQDSATFSKTFEEFLEFFGVPKN